MSATGKKIVIGVIVATLLAAAIVAQQRWRSGPMDIRLDVARKDSGRSTDRFLFTVVTEPRSQVELLGRSVETDEGGFADLEVPYDAVPLGLSKVEVVATRTGFLHFGGGTATFDVERLPQLASFEAELVVSGERKLVVKTTPPTNTVVVNGKSYTPDPAGVAVVPLVPLEAVLDADLGQLPNLLERTKLPLVVTVRGREGAQASDTLGYAETELYEIRRSVLDIEKAPLGWATDPPKTKPVPGLLVRCSGPDEETRECGKPTVINGLTRLRDLAYVVFETPRTIVVSKCGPYVRPETADLQRQFGALAFSPKGITIERIQYVVTLRAYAAHTGKLVATRTIAGSPPRGCGNVEQFDSVMAAFETGNTTLEGGPVDAAAVRAAIATL